MKPRFYNHQRDIHGPTMFKQFHSCFNMFNLKLCFWFKMCLQFIIPHMGVNNSGCGSKTDETNRTELVYHPGESNKFGNG
jgi:hypothetical protein